MTQTAPAMPTRTAEARPARVLPDGWEITEYAGRGGKSLFAVYSQGRRLASGMTTEASALRWARLLVHSELWAAA